MKRQPSGKRPKQLPYALNFVAASRKVESGWRRLGHQSARPSCRPLHFAVQQWSFRIIHIETFGWERHCAALLHQPIGNRLGRVTEEAMEGESFALGCILDGFPRTRPQADALDRMLAAKGLNISSVVNINVDDATIIGRLLQRGRADDSESIIRHRLDIYNDETAPLLEFYSDKGLLTSVDGIGEVETVNERILAAIASSGVTAHHVPDTTSDRT